MKKKLKQPKIKAVKPDFDKSKPFFSVKEIIFRSDGYAKVFYISSKLQIFLSCLLAAIAVWTAYSYWAYNHSVKIISTKDQELGATRDAYVDLMTDFTALHKNVISVIDTLENYDSSSVEDLELYKNKALVVEDRIKQITTEADWTDDNKILEKTHITEAILQRDIATSERDILKKQLKELLEDVDELQNAEMEIMKRIEEVAGSEITKIKNAINAINKPLKAKSKYFNPMANKKTDNKGGPFIPVESKSRYKGVYGKMTEVVELLDNWEYYQEVISYVPAGKPVWSYWLTSPFGRRSDPFKNSQAIHKGVDLASRTGNKIRTMGKGKVIKSEFNATYGNLIEIDHGNGFKTKYAHMHKRYVKKGDSVEVDEVIGEVGSTGRSTGPHLHYEIIYLGTHVDPLPFIKAKI